MLRLCSGMSCLLELLILKMVSELSVLLGLFLNFLFWILVYLDDLVVVGVGMLRMVRIVKVIVVRVVG